MYLLPDYVRLHTRRDPAGEAVVDDSGDRLTHAQRADAVWSLARGLLAVGVRKGDRVGVLTGNCVFADVAALGIAASGGVFTPYNARWATPELVHGVAETSPKVVLVERHHVDQFEAALATGELDSDIAVWREGEEYESKLVAGGPVDVGLTPADPFCILFTGGTTGYSKGVVLSHETAINNSLCEIADCGIATDPRDRTLLLTPISHSAALMCFWAPHVVMGRTNIMVRKFDEDSLADLVGRERATNSFMIPNMIRRLLKSGAFDSTAFRTHFRQIHSGGGLLRMPDKRGVKEILPGAELYFRYGLTEGGPMVTRLLDSDILRPELDGSIGCEYTFTEVQVQDLDGRELPPGELGEIAARGPQVMLGYFNRPEETAKTMRGGWMHTGDLAVRDDQGYLYFRDRAKDMIKSGGENVYASEIEQLLYTHPAVMECGVLGVPSTEWDEEVRAVVAFRPGQTSTETELRDFLRRSLAGYKVPKKIVFVDYEAMPVNPSGKVVKKNLRELVGW